MKLSVEEAGKEAWAAFNLFRTWFTPEEIHAIANLRQFVVGVKRDGKQFFLAISDTGDEPTATAMIEAFKAFAAKVPPGHRFGGEGEEDEIDKAWNNSVVRHEAVNIVAALTMRGIHVGKAT